MGTGLLSRLGSTVILKGWAFHEKLSIPGLQSSDLGRTWGRGGTIPMLALIRQEARVTITYRHWVSRHPSM